MKFSSLFSIVAALGIAGAALAQLSPTHTIFPVSKAGIVSAERAVVPSACWWDNGMLDGRNALQSQTLGSFSARAADDYTLKGGHWSMIDTFVVRMAVSNNVAEPNVELEIYDDCNGKPGALRTTMTMPDATEVFPSPFPGFKLWEFTFSVDEFAFGALDGCTRVWLSPFGRGTGYYFWPTAGNGVVQGVQGQFLAPSLGYIDWTDMKDAACCNICSDFYFRVCGKVCSIIKDQGDYDLAGLTSIKFPNIDAYNARAADNFQIAGFDRQVQVCRIEAYFATNCDPARVFGEIYSNECELPTSLLFTLSNPEFFPTGQTFAGLTVYLFRFDAPDGVILSGGNNYWFSLAATAAGTIFDNGVFLFSRQLPGCKDIHITEGVYRNPFDDFNVFTPVSDPDLAGVARDFAFRVYGSTVAVLSTRPSVPGDVNQDGTVNFQDLTDVLRNWGATSN